MFQSRHDSIVGVMPSSKDVLILDLGDVLFSWSASENTPGPASSTSATPTQGISSKAFRGMLQTGIWHDWERGRIDYAECIANLARGLKVLDVTLEEVLTQAKKTLRPNIEFVSFVKRLRAENTALKVYAMSNMAAPDFEVVRAVKGMDWSIFDEVFISGTANARKPDLKFFRHVVQRTGANPERILFVDDNIENILSARSMGWHSIRFDSTANVCRRIANVLGNPIDRAQQWLESNKGKMETVDGTGEVVLDNFAQLCILETTGRHDLADVKKMGRRWNMFSGPPPSILGSATYPDDIDNTCFAYYLFDLDPVMVNEVMDEMLQYKNDDGILLVYFENIQRPRIDPVVCINHILAFDKYNRAPDVRPQLEWVSNVMRQRAYVEGTRYHSADWFLWSFATRLMPKWSSIVGAFNTNVHGDIQRSNQSKILMTSEAESLVRERVIERIGLPGDALELAQRILACAAFGVKDIVDAERLKEMQYVDGGWETSCMYRYGKSQQWIGNRGFTTALAVKALQCAM